MCPLSVKCFPNEWNLCAACVIAFEGQPLIKQVPPALSPSTIIVSIPSCPDLIAAT